jgi:hypothetical protein
MYGLCAVGTETLLVCIVALDATGKHTHVSPVDLPAVDSVGTLVARDCRALRARRVRLYRLRHLASWVGPHLVACARPRNLSLARAGYLLL